MKTGFFLHWGPGANAAVEREWFGDTLSMDWWDQPTPSLDSAHSFEEIVTAAQARLHSHFARQGRTRLFAHSFGGQIALELLRRNPEHIEDVTMLACGPNPCRGFLSLAQKLPGQELHLRLAAAQASLSAETFWPLVQQISTVPGFMDLYWHSEAARNKYRDLTSRVAPLDMSAFSAVLSYYLAHKPQALPSDGAAACVPVRHFIGLNDPLMEIKEDSKAWTALIPWMQIQIVEAGHFIQFERASSEWY